MNREIELTDDLLYTALRVDDRPLPRELRHSVRAAVAATPRASRLRLALSAAGGARVANPAVPSAVWLMLLTGVLLAGMLATALFVASQPRRPAPFGLAGTGLLAFSVDGDIHVANADGSGRRALTVGQRFDRAAVWSPDGRRVAYLSTDRYGGRLVGPTTVWVVDADGSGARAVSPDLEASDHVAPSWAPDSRQLVFAAVEGTPEDEQLDASLVVVDVDRGAPRRLAGDGPGRAGAPAWSPDGSLIAYVRFDPDTPLSADGLTVQPGNQHVHVVEPDGDNDVRIASGPDMDPSGFSWSPDGTSLVYARRSPGDGDMFVARATRAGTGWTEHILVGRDGAERSPEEFAPVFSNDGRRVAFLRRTLVGRPANYPANDLYVINADGSEERLVTGTTLDIVRPCWTPDDVGITAFGQRQAGATDADIPVNRILIARVEGGATSTVAADVPVGGQLHVCSWQRRPVADATALPSVPPPGAPANGLLAFAMDGEVHVANGDGSGLRRVTDGPTVKSSPVWSPDGRRLAYIVSAPVSDGEPAQPGEVWILDPANSSDLLRVSASVPVHPSSRLSWSPDARQLAFIDMGQRIHIAHVDGRDPRPLGDHADGSRWSAPVWSPDGSLIAYVRTPSREIRHLYVSAPDGGEEVQVTDVPLEIDAPAFAWAPDGQSLLYAAQAAGPGFPGPVAIARRGPDGWSTSRLIDPAQAGGDDGQILAVSWSNDGRRVAFVVQRGTAELWVAEADGTGPTRMPFSVAGAHCWSPDDRHIAATRLGSPIAIYPLADPASIVTVGPADGPAVTGCSWQRVPDR